jgi:FkbM family methyltransferase
MSGIPNHRLRTHLMHLFHLRVEDSEPELRKLAMLLPSKKRCAVDIGANFGHYSIELSKYFSSVIAFEINDALTHDLSRFNKKIKVVNIGLSSSAGAATLYIPLLNGNFPLVGWASLAPGNCPDTDTHQEKAVRIAPLDSFDIAELDFMKIDVEGHELEVLRGARKTLETNSPTLLIEIKRENVKAVSGYLREIGYEMVNKESLIGQSNNENFLFVKKSEQVGAGNGALRIPVRRTKSQSFATTRGAGACVLSWSLTFWICAACASRAA